MTDKDASSLADPLNYPFDIWPTCFAVSQGRATAVPIASLPLDDVRSVASVMDIFRESSKDPIVSGALNIVDPIAFLSCGSNASPRRFTEKLSRCPDPRALGVRVATLHYTPCYAATLSFYGSVPATFESGEFESFPFLMITAAANLDTIFASETRTGNYDLYRSASGSRLDLDCPVYAFIAKFGAIHLKGAPVALREFAGRAGGLSQSEIVARVLDEIGLDASLSNFRTNLANPGYRESLRNSIIDRYATEVVVKGFERVDRAPRLHPAGPG